MKRMLLMTAAAMTLLLTPCGITKSYAAENSSINIETTIIGHINAYTVNFSPSRLRPSRNRGMLSKISISDKLHHSGVSCEISIDVPEIPLS